MTYLFLIYLLCGIFGVICETQEYHFNVGYVKRNPDGLQERSVIGINGQWPPPTIRVKKHDRVVIHVKNSLEDQNTSLHFHGLFQKGSNAMDGPEMVTQCPIPPGATFLYNFTVEDQAGTYWYHSHSGAQYGDGLRGFFIIDDDKPLPFKYDEDVTLTLSDWYHNENRAIMRSFLNRYNPTGAEPIPQSALFNDSKNVEWQIAPDSTYFLRIVNVGLFVSQYVYIEGHNFTIVEVDGVLVEPQEADSLYIAVAQRVGVLVHTKKHAEENFRFVNALDEEMLDFIPEDLERVSTNWVVYDRNKKLPAPLESSFSETIARINPFDDYELKPLRNDSLYNDPDYEISLNFTMQNLGDGVSYALFNGKKYVPPKVPTLLTVFDSGEYANHNIIYGSNTNSFILQKDEIVQIVLNNMDPGKHPFHLHGHVFQLISRSETGEDDDNPIVFDPSNKDHIQFPEKPLIRDTVMVNPNGFIVLRFKADNPGVWLFHCHVDWHLEQGLAITLIEAPSEIQSSQSVIENHYEACKLANVSSKGNAAGHYGSSTEWFDLTGENVQPDPLPESFTMKGYIAFVICTLIAFYGIFSVYHYGMEDVKTDTNKAVIKKLHSILEKYGTLDENEETSLVSLNSIHDRANH
ncbi:Piso0_005559 [Millerozyma farinosa CBS 7064]|uniref:Piso0_005559 protein n=1 Tax=Pichia sorbitophila (strain ATCC MYA-4447 / BCRC 22081 / CBS 7064 / NBRC 10061 / NRRL Y-12695) TaxID=559304 RepID=G8Y2A8_PICSO|nr:Piso0_005559 [Millerozyma farinosa CBS 7064]